MSDPPEAGSSCKDEATLLHIQRYWDALRIKSPLYDYLFRDITLTSASTGVVTARLTLTPIHINSKGGLHGSVSATLMDWIGGLAIAAWDHRNVTGISTDLHVTFLSIAGVGDTIEVEGTAEKVGGTLGFTRGQIWRVDAEGGLRGNLVAMGSHTKYVRDARYAAGK